MIRLACFLLLVGAAHSGRAQPAGAGPAPITVPQWLFPLSPASAGAPADVDAREPPRLAGTRVTFSAAQVRDPFFAPDWRPQTHTAMPAIVAAGRAPDVWACGYCHLPGGQGRPENASLAGLPAAYIAAQVADIRSGARRSAFDSSAYAPIEYMRRVAQHATDSEVAAAAAYFAAQRLPPRVRVAERARIPRMRPFAWIYAAAPDGGTEVLAGRSPSYLLRQLYAFKTGARAGAGGEPMRRLALQLDEPSMLSVAAYAASLRPAANPAELAGAAADLSR